MEGASDSEETRDRPTEQVDLDVNDLDEMMEIVDTVTAET